MYVQYQNKLLAGPKPKPPSLSSHTGISLLGMPRMTTELLGISRGAPTETPEPTSLECENNLGLGTSPVGDF